MQQTRKTEKLASMQRSMDNKIHCNQQYALETRCYREKELDIMAATKKIEVETMIPFDSSATNERSAEYGRVAYRQGFLDAVSLLKK